ncbi:MAG: hypothetical protein ABEJ56_03805 [Candidatus Nanohaloarchaea archaeon]
MVQAWSQQDQDSGGMTGSRWEDYDVILVKLENGSNLEIIEALEQTSMPEYFIGEAETDDYDSRVALKGRYTDDLIDELAAREEVLDAREFSLLEGNTV